MLSEAKWITNAKDFHEVSPVFVYDFTVSKKITEATIQLTSLGVYDAQLNGKRIGNFIMAPGWTSYEHRLQYQKYDITPLITTANNHLEITVSKGWYHSRFDPQNTLQTYSYRKLPIGIIAEIELTYTDGDTQIIHTDSSWKCKQSKQKFCDLYDGAIYDASSSDHKLIPVNTFDGPTSTLIPQEGEIVCEQDVLPAKSMIVSPKGEYILDFGQNLSGYVSIALRAKKGDLVSLSFAEVLDKEGNFYNANYRSAKALYQYICTDGFQTYKPMNTYYGFRYVRIDQFPVSFDQISLDQFHAIVIHSDLKRTGCLSTSNADLNQLIHNTLWSQKGNFIDVPTDCPQRDERLGWTGDAQVFVKTASYNYDVEKFFTKWLADFTCCQGSDGYIPDVVPNIFDSERCSAAWGDACTICPWEIYLTYGNPDILKRQYDCMQHWVDYITNHTSTNYLWTGGHHYADWLGLDAESGSFKGKTREDFIASAFYAHSVQLLIKSGQVLQKDMTDYEKLYGNIRTAFQRHYPQCQTQTECVLALQFQLTENTDEVSKQLVEKINSCGGHLETGFVGTPYLLHVLSKNGYSDLAYQLLLRREYPSWLYPVTKGATTIWEHWDGIKENGDFWNVSMNSFNHYAYGSVVDWIYSSCAGIQPIEDFPGYAKVKIAPIPNSRLSFLKCTLDTKHGQIRSEWSIQENQWKYEIETPVDAVIVIDTQEYHVSKGKYVYYSDIKQEN